ncbi:LamG-like jellyroll fold domain-containing protein [Hymenobacter sp. BRD67]|uniref:LamG-like jellyroll fold domain-containing protein n=1 Tax=Hymenobacter sp. BRD67 TaxID=2675877 RepID=UPI0015660117|nr:LamG-like jellyroll fold domain-containing protein [Hymenobacter sp. BRD67]QKG54986.1 hypothetical protein GKZ67_21415 [Hymenobacter sp. BRD67]
MAHLFLPTALSQQGARWLAAGLTALALLLAPAGAALAQTTTFNYTGGTQTYTVPAGATAIQVVVAGASSGTYGAVNAVVGAQVTATILVTPGELLSVVVGASRGARPGATTAAVTAPAAPAAAAGAPTSGGQTAREPTTSRPRAMPWWWPGRWRQPVRQRCARRGGGLPSGANGATNNCTKGGYGGTQSGAGSGSYNGTIGTGGYGGSYNGVGSPGGGGGYYGGGSGYLAYCSGSFGFGGSTYAGGGGGGSSWTTATATGVSYVAAPIGNGSVTIRATVPSLATFAPNPGSIGQAVTLTGSNLAGVTSLLVNGVDATASITNNTATSLTFRVPAATPATGTTTLTTATGVATSTAFTVVPQSNNALAFNGTNNYVSLPYLTPVPLGNSAYTLEAWIKPTSMGVYGIIGWGNYGITNQATALRLDPANGGSVRNYWWANDLMVTTGNLADGKWHHVAATFDGTTRTIYVDGVLKGSDTPSGHNVPNAANLRIGSTSVATANNPPTGLGTGEYFPGSLDEVRIYNVGLTQAQVQADMFSASGAAAVPASQVYYANFDQGIAGGNNVGLTSLPDLSGNNSTGTLTNFALTGTTSNWVRSFPTITGISPNTGKSGTSVTVTGTNLTDATGFAFNGLASASFTTPTNDLTATATAPVGVLTGPLSLSAATLTRYNGPVFTLVNDLVVTTTTPIAADSYSSITVNSPGVGTLAGNVTVSGSTTVGSGGTLNDGCFVLGGPSSFTLAAGGTLGICSGQGISAAPAATGSIQNTGARSFSTDALYTYTGTAAQVTGSGLPATVRTLTLRNAAGLTLTGALTTATSAVSLTTGVLSTGAGALTLGPAATLSETATGYLTGTAQTTRNLSTAGAPETFGGLGLRLTPSGATLPGSTLVVRTTGVARAGVGSSQSVLRNYDIRPTQTTGLSVDLTLTFRDDERNGIAAANLRLFKSDDAGATWQGQPATISPTAASGSQPTTYSASLVRVSNFSLWTLGNSANPLPVQLVAFTAQAEGRGARLRWRTASELNNAYFTVEASADGVNFSAVGQVPGHGTTALPQQYTYFDAELSRYGALAVYYRLRQVDDNGQRTYSPVQVVTVPAAGLLSLTPNPVPTDAAARLVGAAPGAEVQVFDAVGRRVLLTLADAAGVARLALPAGLYLVRAGTAPALRLVVE